MRAEQYISPSVLVDDLVGFSRLDWSVVWAGPPLPTEFHFDEWCELRGWKPLTYEFDLKIQTPGGSKWELSANGRWKPVVGVSKEIWMASIQPPESGARVVDKGTEAWLEYRNHISDNVGNLIWQGGAGSKEFPPSPGVDYWIPPESDAGNPYKMAVWKMESYRDPALLVLEMSVSPFSWKEGSGGMAAVRLSIHPHVRVYE